MNIVLSSNEKYLKYVCVMLTSLCANNPVHIDAYILNGGGLSEPIDSLRKLLCKYDIDIHDIVIEDAAFLKDCPVSTDWTVETYYRFFIPWLGEIAADRALYLDVDMIVNGSLSELYDTDFEDADIVAARDCNGTISLSGLSDIRTVMLKPLIPDDGYFNAGMMLMNLERIREKYQPDVYEKAIIEWDYGMISLDQDILNYVHAGKVKYCDWSKYDLFAREAHKSGMTYENVKENAYIIHFAGTKPWNSTNQLHYDIEKLWWDYAFMTPIALELSSDFIVQSTLDPAIEKTIRELVKKNDDLLSLNEKMKSIIDRLSDNAEKEQSVAGGFREQVKTSSEYLEYICHKKETSLLWDTPLTNAEYDLSIIIPCFNQEKYIANCIESVLKQKTKYKFLAVVIDDGSTDSSPSVIDSYAKDANLKIIHQANAGVAAARNRGLIEADSRYVMFVDGDDLLADGAVEEAITDALKLDADVIEYGFMDFDHDAAEEAIAGYVSECRMTYGKSPVPAGWDKLTGYVCGKIYRRHFFDSICFPEGYWFEDSIIQGLVLQFGKSLYKSQMKIYMYRQNPEGATQRSIGDIRAVESFYMMELVADHHVKLGLASDVKWYEYLLKWIALTFVRISSLDDMAKTAVFYKTADFFDGYFPGVQASDDSLKAVEMGLRKFNYNIYREGCALAWNYMIGHSED